MLVLLAVAFPAFGAENGTLLSADDPASEMGGDGLSGAGKVLSKGDSWDKKWTGGLL